jgi:hypothetical protein
MNGSRELLTSKDAILQVGVEIRSETNLRPFSESARPQVIHDLD